MDVRQVVTIKVHVRSLEGATVIGGIDQIVNVFEMITASQSVSSKPVELVNKMRRCEADFY